MADDLGLSKKNNHPNHYDIRNDARAAEALSPYFGTPAKKTINRSELLHRGIPHQNLSPAELTFELKRRHRKRNFILVFSPGQENADLSLDRVVVLKGGKKPSAPRSVAVSRPMAKDLPISALSLRQRESKDEPRGPVTSDSVMARAAQGSFTREDEPTKKNGGAHDGSRILPSLTSLGAVLPGKRIDPTTAHINQTINLGTDEALATYVTARGPTNMQWQRTATGGWVEWNGAEEALIDNRFETSANKITFEIASGDLSDEFFPITYGLAYRTGSGLKFGVLEVMPRAHTEN